MSRLLRDGEYVVFHNNTYYLSGKKVQMKEWCISFRRIKMIYKMVLFL